MNLQTSQCSIKSIFSSLFVLKNILILINMCIIHYQHTVVQYSLQGTYIILCSYVHWYLRTENNDDANTSMSRLGKRHLHWLNIRQRTRIVFFIKFLWKRASSDKNTFAQTYVLVDLKNRVSTLHIPCCFLLFCKQIELLLLLIFLNYTISIKYCFISLCIQRTNR